MFFAPGNEPIKVEKVGLFRADAVILDLEDAVPNSDKVATRESILIALDTMGHLNAYVRVNSVPTGLTELDIGGVVHPNLKGIVLPKTEQIQEITTVEAWLSRKEREAGLKEACLSG
jgi:citrate lyase subunit beta/citryl-CoA lyase